MKAKLLLLAILLSISSFAQVQIQGQIKDKQSKSPLPYSSVIILNSKDSAITMALSDNDGFFTINLKQGTYKLVFRFTGYNDDTLLVKANNDQNLGIIYLKPNVQNIQGVQVKAKLKKEDIDRQVVVVTKQMKDRASNVEEVLEQISGVQYDRYNDQISVDGDTKVLILVDGLKKSENYVKSINPQRIWKIEIIRDPGGRYGLEGYSAIINIILKDNYQGYEVFTSIKGIYAPECKYSKSVANSLSADITITHNKFNFYLDLPFTHNNFNLENYVTRIYQNGLKTYKLPNGKYPSFSAVGNLMFLTSGIDYKINPLNTVSFELNYHYFPGFVTNNVWHVIDSLPDNSTNSYYQVYRSLTPQKYIYGTLFYNGDINNLKIKADLTYENDYAENNNIIRTYPDLDQINLNNIDYQLGDNKTLTKTHTVNSHIDAMYPIGKFSINFGMGYKHRNMLTKTQIIGDTSLLYDYFDNSLTGYLYFAYKLNSTINIKLGTAYENYFLNSQEVNKNMNFIQPYADIKISPSKLLTFKLKYRSETQAPSASQLNPTKRLIDTKIAMQGNPNLSPAYINKLSAKLLILGGLLSVEPYYDFTKNYITQVYIQPQDNNLDGLVTYQNIGKYTNYGTKLNIMIPFGRKIIMQNTADIYWYKLSYQNINRKLHDWTGGIQLIYYNPKIITAGIMYQNNIAKVLTAQGYKTSNNDFVALFVQKKLAKDRLTIMGFYVLPFNSRPGWLDYVDVNFMQTPLYTELSTIDLNILKNVVLFQISYRFSKGRTTKVEKNIEHQQAQVKSFF